MAGEKEKIYSYEPLWGNWNIELFVGKGSYGSVYKVSKKDLGHKYTSAVKIISVPSKEQMHDAVSTLGNDSSTLTKYFEDIVNNIVKEVNVLYTLSGNSNIINYQDHLIVRKEDDIGWDILIRMEYVKSLRKYISDNGLTRRQIIQLGIDICSALQLCSKKGIIHRDIKDDNIFVNEDGIFKLGDFGIAKEMTKTQNASTMIGTPIYLAPEIYRGEKYDVAVDIYSLGIVLYKLLNHGRMPFLPTFPEEIRFKHNEEAIVKRMSGEPMPLPVNAQDELGQAVLKACEFTPTKRYTSAEEMKNDLGRILKEISSEKLDEVIIEKSPEREDAVPDTEVLGVPDTVVLPQNQQRKGSNESKPEPAHSKAPASNTPAPQPIPEKESFFKSLKFIIPVSALSICVVLVILGVMLINNNSGNSGANRNFAASNPNTSTETTSGGGVMESGTAAAQNTLQDATSTKTEDTNIPQSEGTKDNLEQSSQTSSTRVTSNTSSNTGDTKKAVNNSSTTQEPTETVTPEKTSEPVHSSTSRGSSKSEQTPSPTESAKSNETQTKSYVSMRFYSGVTITVNPGGVDFNVKVDRNTIPESMSGFSKISVCGTSGIDDGNIQRIIENTITHGYGMADYFDRYGYNEGNNSPYNLVMLFDSQSNFLGYYIIMPQ